MTLLWWLLIRLFCGGDDDGGGGVLRILCLLAVMFVILLVRFTILLLRSRFPLELKFRNLIRQCLLRMCRFASLLSLPLIASALMMVILSS